MDRTRQSNNRRLWWLLAAVAAVGALILLIPSCGGADGGKTRVELGQEAPDFTVELTDGSRCTLGEERGKVVLLNFWATWCPPCRAEMKRLQGDVIDRFAGRPFRLLAIARGETAEEVRRFLEAEGYAFAAGVDPGEEIYGLYAEEYIPRSFVIDPEGRIVRIEVGYTPEAFDELVGAIETELDRIQ